MIADSELRDDLDDVNEKYNPKSKRITVLIPEITLTMFDATHENNHHYYNDLG